MLSTETFLAVYYIGFGFVIFLGWACVTDTSGSPPDHGRRNRLHRLAVGLAILGVLHPALALAGRDIAAEMGRSDLSDPRAPRTLLVTNWGLALAVAVAALIIASQITALEDAPVVRQIRTGLPFA